MDTISLFFLIFFAFIALMIINTIGKKLRIKNLADDEKTILESAKEKVKKNKKKMDLTRNILLIIWGVITIFYFVYGLACKYNVTTSKRLNTYDENSPLSPYYNSVEYISDLYTPHFCVQSYFNSYLSLLSIYAILYAIIRITTYNIFMKKIVKDDSLTDKEKELLFKCYGGKTIPIVFWTLVVQVISFAIQLINTSVDKPVIYLYPKKDEKVKVKLSKKENLTHSYPKYTNEWNVLAKPDGTLFDENGKEYYALYYECKYKNDLTPSVGFCVKGEDTIAFLEEKLELLGLNPKEREEFIIYWLPKMENNLYNYIYFKTGSEADEVMGLDINPRPDTMIRVLMFFKPLNKKIDVKEQKITTLKREGFTVVEWGGSQI